MFIKTTTHKRIVAEKDAEIAGLMKRLAATQMHMDADIIRIRGLKDRCNDLFQESHDLRARLAPFTKIRNRDSRGRFIKDTVV